MDNLELKKIEEKQYLKHFILECQNFPTGKIIETESPDFIIKLNKKNSIGLEMTKLYFSEDNKNHKPNHHFNTIENKIIEKSKNKYFEKNKLNISAHFNLSDIENFSTNNNNTNNLSDKICNIISENLKNKNFNKFFQIKISDKKLPKEIKSITLVRHPDDKLSFWRCCDNKIDQKNFIENIEDVLNKKEEKFELYQKRMNDSYWLVIVAECIKCSTNFSINNILEKWHFNSSFNKVYLFSLFDQKIYELNV